MSQWIRKLVSACVASAVLCSFVGCGEEKSPPRYVDEKEAAKPKDPNAR